MRRCLHDFPINDPPRPPLRLTQRLITVGQRSGSLTVESDDSLRPASFTVLAGRPRPERPLMPQTGRQLRTLLPMSAPSPGLDSSTLSALIRAKVLVCCSSSWLAKISRSAWTWSRNAVWGVHTADGDEVPGLLSPALGAVCAAPRIRRNTSAGTELQ